MPHHRCDYPMRWSDMDAYGHVNNVQYLRFLEDARIEAFGGTRDGDASSLLDSGILVVAHRIEYRRPLRWRPEPVHIDLWVTRLAGAQVDVAYEVYDEPGEGGDDARVVYAVATSTLVAYDLRHERPTRLTPAQRGRLEGLVGEPVRFRRAS